MAKKMKRLSKEEGAAIKKYDCFVNSKSKSNYPHGIGIGVERSEAEKKFYIYDNGCNVRHEYSVDKLATRITYPCGVMIFEIDV